ncbi:hypothetical protein PFISCL1PPCAC_19199, partial [Pristionchus fissidentatus]
MDLPNEILSRIISFLDIESRLKLRVNKRLDQLLLAINQDLYSLTIECYPKYNEVFIPGRYGCSFRPYKKVRTNSLIQGMRRIAKNTHFKTIHLYVVEMDSKGKHFVDLVNLFSADAIELSPTETITDWAESDNDVNGLHNPFQSGEIDRHFILEHFGNRRELCINFECSALKLEDLK